MIHFWRRLKTKFNNVILRKILARVGDNLHAFGLPYVTVPENLEIGSRCTINQNVYIGSRAKVTIGNDVRISSRVSIETGFLETDCMVRDHDCLPIFIEDNVWIGTGAIILPGVRVHKNSIIGAGAVVVKDVPMNLIVAGNPAKPIRELTFS